VVESSFFFLLIMKALDIGFRVFLPLGVGPVIGLWERL
jgi:hypothetical protein